MEETGDLLAHVDTVSAAKDMDVLRAVLGQEKLNYLGYSYGSLLGTTYANLFPDRVGQFVLDGAIDPTVSDEQQTLFQIEAFEKALRAFLESSDFLGTKKLRENFNIMGFDPRGVGRLSLIHISEPTRPY